MIKIGDILEDFFLNCSIHGLRFISKKSKNHWTERLFWIICCALSWYGSILLILSSYDNFQSNPLSFVVSTTHLDWSTSFPSVSVCEIENVNKSKMFAKEYFGEAYVADHTSVMNEIAYFQRITPYLNKICLRSRKKNAANCTGIDIVTLARKIRSSCEETFERCRWNKEEFDCCKYFLHLETEVGICYSINNVQTGNTSEPGKFKDLLSNASTGPGSLHLELKTPAQIFIHSKTDVPNMNTLESDIITVKSLLGKLQEVYLAVHETYNVDGVAEVDTEKRKCQFPWEKEGRERVEQYTQYSYSACIVDCRRRAELTKCNCTSHLLPYPANGQRDKNVRICNINDLLCIKTYYDFLSDLEAPWNPKEEVLKCSCLSGCEEMQVENILQRDYTINDKQKSYIELKLHYLPSEKYNRKVVRSQLDLVVSMGSAVGLFVGASLLSFVEIIYYFTIRQCGRHSKHKDSPTHPFTHRRHRFRAPVFPTLYVRRNKPTERGNV